MIVLDKIVKNIERIEIDENKFLVEFKTPLICKICLKLLSTNCVKSKCDHYFCSKCLSDKYHAGVIGALGGFFLPQTMKNLFF